MHELRFRRAFWAGWLALFACKAWLAARMPLFGDEAWYWLEGQHLALAYSDLPGATAWLARLGVAVAGDTPFGVRWPFLLLGMALPLLLRAAARRRAGVAAGDLAGCLALALPLLATAGVLALPDVPLTLAAVLCLDAALRLVQRVDRTAAWMLAMGLVLGASSHYRFLPLAAAGLLGLLLEPGGRRALRAPPVLLALFAGALAWLPLLHWNLLHAGAGWTFQLGERHPWRAHAEGLWLPLAQLLAVGPVLLALLLATLRDLWRRRRAGVPGDVLLLVAAAAPLLLYGVLAFFADRDRVSFHWLLQAWLPLLLAAPATWATWRPAPRAAVFALALPLLLGALAFLALGAVPDWRARVADSQLYPDNFAGWEEIAAAVRARPAHAAPLLADNFMLGAQLAFALGREVPVLDHPLNHKHGRAAQLALWGLAARLEPGGAPRTLVMEDGVMQLKRRLAHYQRRCAEAGGLALESIVAADHGRKRFLLFDTAPDGGGCRLPAVAWLDAPLPGARVEGAALRVSGWAFKDEVGIARVELTLDGRVVAQVRYGLEAPHVAAYWGTSRDPLHPRVGFEAQLDLATLAPGDHWLGLVLHGRDGSRETWPEQRLRR